MLFANRSSENIFNIFNFLTKSNCFPQINTLVGPLSPMQLPYTRVGGTKTTSKTSGRITGKLLSMCISAPLDMNPVRGEFSDFSYVNMKKMFHLTYIVVD